MNMEAGSFLLIFRLVGFLVIAFWIINIGIAARKDRAWPVPESRSWPFPRPTRNIWIAAGVLGIAAGIGILLFSVWLERYLRA